MSTINTKTFRLYNQKDIYKFLMLENQTVFEIIIPKSGVTRKKDHFKVHWDYTLAAFAGHKLNEIADSFGYSVPPVFRKHPFKFDVEIRDMEKFTDLLYTIIKVFHNNYDRADAFDSFYNEGSEFFAESFKERYRLPTCGLIFIAHRHLMMHEAG
ncbi:MAG: hypothetical protein ABI760_19820 [Ferruginibacter sp.]